jgi:uncharacterized protein
MSCIFYNLWEAVRRNPASCDPTRTVWGTAPDFDDEGAGSELVGLVSKNGMTANPPISPLAPALWLKPRGPGAILGCFVLSLLLVSGLRAQNGSAESSDRKEFFRKLVAAAIERTHHFVRYDPSYVKIPYPGGDVPPDTGVCTDVIIRSYRAVGVDLQKEVHEDMMKNFSAYPRNWNWLLSHPDPNIDHRRVPNLMVFFSRKGETLPISRTAEDYSPGDLVTWDLGGGVPHIGIVVDKKSPETGHYLVVHNIGQGPKMEEVLFNWKITGHYRYFGPAPEKN